MNPDFWKDRKVFITGHTGFKGSWLSLWLQQLSAHVVGYSLPAPTEPSLFEVADVASGMVSITGDIRDYNHLRDSLEEHQPDIVFHMAAQSVVRESYKDPIETYSSNVMGTVNLLQALRHLSRDSALVNITSDKSYQNREWIWGYRETDRLGGHDPYSNSKACAELVTQSFTDSFFNVAGEQQHHKWVATARAGNVIGGGDWTRDQLIPDVLTAFHEQRPVVLRSPQSVRPWQFVLDCLGGYLTLAERLASEGQQYTGAWNFGPRLEDTLPVQDMVERLIAKWPGEASWIRDEQTHPHEAGCLRLDTTKTTLLLGWTPRLALAQSLDWITDWYVRYFRGENPKSLCMEQIVRYMDKKPCPQA
jgi:CDP-glucose 4,6-dehydratase